ncbi:hypothetical protein [Anaeroselena agilis]|uniref:Uncharacterized protein n=1 Tax=Anaeroselena agilis TaxID=3063788 RepID=A0ABU3NV16_9FIRM|nr:hypothetical protein [Selenomonadales bacterium 4137-cl]
MKEFWKRIETGFAIFIRITFAVTFCWVWIPLWIIGATYKLITGRDLRV